MGKSNPGQTDKNQGAKPQIKSPDNSHRKPGGGKKHNSVPDVANPRNPKHVKRDSNPDGRKS